MLEFVLKKQTDYIYLYDCRVKEEEWQSESYFSAQYKFKRVDDNIK